MAVPLEAVGDVFDPGGEGKERLMTSHSQQTGVSLERMAARVTSLGCFTRRCSRTVSPHLRRQAAGMATSSPRFLGATSLTQASDVCGG